MGERGRSGSSWIRITRPANGHGNLTTRDRSLAYCLTGIVVKASTSGAEDPGFESRCRRDFSESTHTIDLKIGTPVATLPGAWHYKISAGTGWPGVSKLWLGEVESLIWNFYLSVALSVQILSWDTLACCWDVKQPTNNQLTLWPSGKASASRAAEPGSNRAFALGLFLLLLFVWLVFFMLFFFCFFFWVFFFFFRSSHTVDILLSSWRSLPTRSGPLGRWVKSSSPAPACSRRVWSSGKCWQATHLLL